MRTSSLPIALRRAPEWASRAALADAEGTLTYGELLAASAEGARAILEGRSARRDPARDRPHGDAAGDLDGTPVAVLAPPGRDFAVAWWSIWRAGGMLVPLATSHPEPELAHALSDSGARTAIVHPTLAERLARPVRALGVRVLSCPELCALEPEPPTRLHPLPAVAPDRVALMLYTSGTTGRPKGVVHTHVGLEAQMASLTAAWGWSASDHILLALPLHHLHGLVNVLACALRNGACCTTLPLFEARAVWEAFAREDLTLFMGVPTQYARLLDAWDAADAATRRRWSEGAGRLRLMVSGSAALPTPTLERWAVVTGHRLLERYGMTEIGMALSNPLAGERRAGHVGTPLPSVQVRLVDDADLPVPEGGTGEIEVRGPTLFREYWRRPEATAQAFHDGWFRTGDLALVEGGSYRILGRRSQDILNTGGFRVSALEIEAVLLAHPSVREVAVVGVPDETWGERVAAAVVPAAEPGSPTLADLRAWAGGRLAPYKLPTLLAHLGELPRTSMGKVDKHEVRAEIERSGPRSPGRMEASR